MFLTSNVSTAKNIFDLIGVLFVFVFILICVYFVTRWLGGLHTAQNKEKNIRIIESCRIQQNKFVQIVKVGNKYIILGIGKEEITSLGEVDEAELNLSEISTAQVPSFKDVISKVNLEQFKNNKKNKK